MSYPIGMTIRFIYFDLGRVLLDFTHERGFAQIASLTGVSDDAVRHALFDTGLSDRYDTGELSTAEFHREFCELTKTSPTVEELSTAWSDIFELIPATITLATSLKSAGNRIGILSNTCEAHWEYAANRFRILSQIFDPVITSYEVGAMKPSREIYDAAAAVVGHAKPDEIVFVDDRSENVDGAKEAGWRASLFQGALPLADELEGMGVVFNR